MPSARSSSPPPRAVAVTVVAVVAAVLVGVVIAIVAGGGGSHTTGTSADPARVVPASAPLYASADVRLKGEKRSATLAVGRALTHQPNPYLRLLSVLQTPGSPAPNFSRDVAPWLGNRAGIFLTSLRSSGPLLTLIQQGLLGQTPSTGAFPFGSAAGGGSQGAIVLGTRDTRKAKAFLQAAASRAGAHATSYRGVAYELSGGDVALGMVRRFAVIGSDAGIHAVIDTTLGGPSLARAPSYSSLLAFTPAKAVAHVYANAGAGGGRSATGLGGLLGLLPGAGQINVSLVPSGSSLALDVDTLAASSAGAQLRPFTSESAHALGELPGDSWFAVGLGDVGHMLAADVQRLQGLASIAAPPGPAAPAAGLNLRSLVEALTTPLKVLGANTPEAKRSFQSWMGSAGIFAAGTSLLELKGAVVIASNNAAGSRAAVGKLASRLRAMGDSVQPASVPGTDAAVSARLSGLPVALVIASGRAAGGQSRFVIGLGEPSVAAALNPSSVLASAASFSSAAAALGEGAQPSMIFDVPALLSVLEGIGLTEDPSISGFVPYLRSLTTVDGGAHPLDARVERFKLVLGLRPGA
ncbi:MAG TPA: DUF3352 domain-containing protein [Solirubrobacteraceae bacterium]|nr:DUF3352 domain-containing protein [Solirubrobacteraceae bacterium]